MNQPVIITAALTGAEVSPLQQPALPITPEQIAVAAHEACQAGAAIVHVHARWPDGTPTQDGGVYAQIIEKIQSRCDVIVQVSTGGAVGMTAQERLQPVLLQPEMATLSMGSVNFGDGVFLNEPTDMRDFLRVMQERQVRPEFEIFDSGMLSTLNKWIKSGWVDCPVHCDFVLGVPGAMSASVASLVFLHSQLPPHATWSVAGMGPAQLSLGAVALAMGGHVRVGFEDNVYFRKGELAHSNAQLVQRMADVARLLERPVATPSEARAILNLRRNNGPVHHA